MASNYPDDTVETKEDDSVEMKEDTNAAEKKEIKEIKDKIDSLEKEIERIEQKEEERVRDFSIQCQQELKERLSALEANVTVDYQNRLEDFSQRYRTHQQETITSQQTHILRVSRVIRDVSRQLGDNWKQVFRYLMRSFPKDVVDKEIKIIDQQKPFMQAYNALQKWRSMKGDDFDVTDIIQALKDCSRFDLVDKINTTLESERDSLLAISDFGQGVVSGRATAGAAGAEGEEDAADAGSTSSGASGSSTDHHRADKSEPVSDKALLQLARKLGASWKDLGAKLDVPEEELVEIHESDGNSYQAAFKMLWYWKDSASKLGEARVNRLVQALSDIGRNDLVELL